MEIRIAYLRPEEIISHLKEMPVIFVPVAPLEWHGPHLPLGVDALNAEEVAMGVCRQIGGLVWPTLFWGTERDRTEQEIKNLGFPSGSYIVGMDFPNNTLPSGYCPEEIFGVLIRETLRQISRMPVRLAVLVNGHGAVNHNTVLRRLATEFNHTTSLGVYVRTAFPQKMIDAGSIAHAGSDETNLMLHYHPKTVDISNLPPRNQPFHYADFAIVDGPGFDGKGRPDKVVEDDPRRNPSPERGKEIFQTIVGELSEEIQIVMKGLD
jgi:creatinine amidohydrolase